MFILAYFWLLYTASTWFMTLVDPISAQSAFISVVIGTGAAWFGLYVNSNASQDSDQSPYLNPTEDADHFDPDEDPDAKG